MGIALLSALPMNDSPSPQARTKGWYALLALILIAGTAVRVIPSASFDGVGFDEHMYATYVEAALQTGITGYGGVVTQYLSTEATHHQAIVPATRIAFIWPAVLIARCNGGNSLAALKVASCAAAIALLLLAALIACRLGNSRQAILVAALMAAAPLQISLGQRALVDEYFAFWAILTAWFLFETLRPNASRSWMILYGVSLFVLVLTKENAAFVCAALLATWGSLAVLRMAKPNYLVVVVTGIAGAAGVALLSWYVGGIGQWIDFYRDYSAKSLAIPYVIKFQDGAWYRYLVDFTMVSPLVVAFAFGRLCNLDKTARADVSWALFLGFSVVAMSSVPLGMSLRFAAYWDLPLRWLAASQIGGWAERCPLRWRVIVAIGITLVLVTIDLTQYHRLFIANGIYDPVSAEIFRASKMVR